ncbi:MAG TPA: P-II family nitrogen regulator [archaeon]|nr:P-II family nitrogen regulator [archaeon]
MKKIEAVVWPEKFSYIKDALAKAGYPSLTTYEVKGRGRQGGVVQLVREKEVKVDLLPKTKIEVIVNDNEVEKVIKVITATAKTGAIGDGKIFVFPVEEVIHIRTGERGTVV